MAGWVEEGDDDDAWAAAAEEAGYGEDAEMGAEMGAEAAEAAEVDGEPASKRARASRVLSSHGRADLSPLQALLQAADKAAGAVRQRKEAAKGKKSMKAKAAAAATEAAEEAAEKEAAASAAADEALLAHIGRLNPSALDLELRGLGGSGGLLLGAQEGALDELGAALRFFGRALCLGRDFELLQAVFGVFLKVHQETLATAPELGAPLRALRAAQGSSWGELKEQLHCNLCLLSFLCRTRS